MGGRSNLNCPKPVPFVFFVRAFGREKNTLTIITTIWGDFPTQPVWPQNNGFVEGGWTKITRNDSPNGGETKLCFTIGGRMLHKKSSPKKTTTKETSFLMGRPKNPGKISGWKLKNHPIEKENHLPSTSFTKDAQFVQFFGEHFPNGFGERHEDNI